MAVAERFDLDDIDKKILTLVQTEPDITHTEIAERIQRSQPAVGMRINKLKNKGILCQQNGINFKNAEDIFFAIVMIKANNPQEIIEMSKYCPFIINCLRLTGNLNIMVLLASTDLKKIDRVVSYHFRNNSQIIFSSMDIVSGIAKDFILPMDFNVDDHDPNLQEGCGDKCTYRRVLENRVK